MFNLEITPEEGPNMFEIANNSTPDDDPIDDQKGDLIAPDIEDLDNDVLS